MVEELSRREKRLYTWIIYGMAGGGGWGGGDVGGRERDRSGQWLRKNLFMTPIPFSW